jgi:VWFA-related protein
MMKHVVLAALTVLAYASASFAQADERVIYAGVVDQKGNPVAGLTEKDFIVREDGQSREVLRVATDEDPLQIALLVDNSVEMRNRVADLRRGIVAFVGALRPGIEVSVITLAERPTIVVPYTTDRAALQKGADRVIALTAGNYLLDGIAEVSQGLAKRPNARAVIAVMTGRGLEYSSRDYTDVLRIVRESGTPALHVTLIGGFDTKRELANRSTTPFEGQRDSADAERDIVLGRLTKETGGRYEEVLSTSALAMKMQQMASELSNQYRITYARPQRLVPPKKTEISARDPKLRARGMLAPQP